MPQRMVAFAGEGPMFLPNAITHPADGGEFDAASEPLAFASRTAPPASAPAPSGEAAVVKDALTLALRGRSDAATERRDALRDPAARKLVEWAILRSDNNSASFARYAAFIEANPNWPSVGMLRRRAEAQLWQERRDGDTVAAFFAKQPPVSTKGRLAMARALLASGDRAGAQRFVREAWRAESCPAEVESQILDTFPDFLTQADDKARMDRRLYASDFDVAMRAAQRLGGTELALARARAAVTRKAADAGALLEAVPNGARTDPGYILARAQWLRRNDRIGEAAQLLLSAPRDPALIHDTDEWWVERRLLARKLLDENNAPAAYRVVREAAPPAKENYKVEHQFTAGWIALRFMNDPLTALRHFGEIDKLSVNPIARARAGYWLGRAAEAAGRTGEARGYFEAAARYPSAYYGQLAAARIGQREITARRPPQLTDAQRAGLRNADMVRAVELLYAAGHRDLVIPFVADAGERVSEVGALAGMAEATARAEDARAMVFIGKAALGRGHAFDHYAFPSVGIPRFTPIGPQADRSLSYAIARQESGFNQRTVSTARALGLMQVTAAAGRYVARKFRVGFDERRLLSDPVYNTQMGTAEIADLVQDYDGNYALAFAGYNAGRGRVREWVKRYGDPRDPEVDPVDWVERIPFAETRNYVQRVMENMQIYRARLASSPARLTIEADLRGARRTRRDDSTPRDDGPSRELREEANADAAGD